MPSPQTMEGDLPPYVKTGRFASMEENLQTKKGVEEGLTNLFNAIGMEANVKTIMEAKIRIEVKQKIASELDKLEKLYAAAHSITERSGIEASTRAYLQRIGEAIRNGKKSIDLSLTLEEHDMIAGY